MNIFFLDRDPRIAATYHNDKHVVKMILESAQLLSTAHRVLDGQITAGKSKAGRNVKRYILNDSRENVLYQAGHVNHPSAVWVRSNMDHYRWVHDLLYFLIGEYKYRYNDKDHACQKLQNDLLDCPHNIPIVDWEDPPLAMPDECKVGSAVDSYRNYYMTKKRDMASWKIRGVPSWYK